MKHGGHVGKPKSGSLSGNKHVPMNTKLAKGQAHFTSKAIGPKTTRGA